jgi:hypothetical protein
MSRPPFINMFDVAGILMLALFFFIFLAALGSKHVTWNAVAVVAIVFGAAIFFAKRGAP